MLNLKNVKNIIISKSVIIIVFTLFFIIPILLHLYHLDDIILFLLKDGSIYESIGALSALMSSIIFFYLYKINKKYIVFLLLGVLLLFLFGEEISWGQRLFNFNIPDYFISNNYQKETSIHNLNLFHNQDRALFDYGTYLIIIYFVYFTLLTNIFPYFKKILNKLKIPVSSLFVAFLMLYSRELNNVAEKIFVIQDKTPDMLRIGEIYETSIEIIILIFACECFKHMSKKNIYCKNRIKD